MISTPSVRELSKEAEYQITLFNYFSKKYSSLDLDFFCLKSEYEMHIKKLEENIKIFNEAYKEVKTIDKLKYNLDFGFFSQPRLKDFYFIFWINIYDVEKIKNSFRDYYSINFEELYTNSMVKNGL